MEGLLFLVMTTILGGVGGMYWSSRRHALHERVAEEHRKRLEEEGYKVVKIQECTCSPVMRDTYQTDSGKTVCLTCGKRVFP